MTTPTSSQFEQPDDSGHPDDAPFALPPERDERVDTDTIAQQRFVHGLLAYSRGDDKQSQEERVQRVMDSIASTPTSDDVKSPTIAPLPLNLRRYWKPLSGLAAAAVILLALSLTIFVPNGSTAYAIVQSSIEASRAAGDHRYEVSTPGPQADAPSGDGMLMATLDIRGTDHVLLQAITPEGFELITGRNPEGEWAIRLDGSIERYHADHVRPRWANLGESALLVETVEGLLDGLSASYELVTGDDEPLPSVSEDDRSRLRITGFFLPPAERSEGPPLGGEDMESRRSGHRGGPGRGHDPQRVELWIHPETFMVERMELHWDHPMPLMEMEGEHLPEPPRPGEHDRNFEKPFPPPVPHRIIFNLVEAPDFTDGWFEPETYARDN